MKCQHCHQQTYVVEIVARRLQEEFVGEAQVITTGNIVRIISEDEALRARMATRGRALMETVPPYCFACWQTAHQ